MRHPFANAGSALVRATIRAMLDSEHVAALRADGHSFRAIAALLGASLGAVQRAWKRHQRTTEDACAEDEAKFVFDLEPELVEPFTFWGVEVEVVQYRGDDPRVVEGELWLDGTGRSVSVLDIWRYCEHRTEYDDYETGERVRADMDRQRREWAEGG